MSQWTRRRFLHNTTLAAGGASLGLGCGDTVVPPAAEAAATGPSALTMWEFSWLVRRTAPEAEYADWDRVLDELAALGYDTIRLDAFPHLLAAGANGETVERFTILPQSELFFWGNHEPVEVAPKAGLIEFLGKMRDRGMKAGLSTWFNDDTTHRADDVVTPEDYARIWRETLDILAEADLLDVVSWVDLCNEFPLGKWARGAYRYIFDDEPDNPFSALNQWDDEQKARVQRYFDEAIPALRAAYPDLRYTFSFAGFSAWPNLEGLDVSEFDLAEVHIWLSDDLNFQLQSGQTNLLLETEGSLDAHVERAPGVYFDQREHWLEILRTNISGWVEWADAQRLPLVTSESWGPINYSDVAPLDDHEEWAWVKDVCAEGVRMASEYGFEGICTSNFCQPQFPGMWSDAEWHQRLTELIHGGELRRDLQAE